MKKDNKPVCAVCGYVGPKSHSLYDYASNLPICVKCLYKSITTPGGVGGFHKRLKEILASEQNNT